MDGFRFETGTPTLELEEGNLYRVQKRAVLAVWAADLHDLEADAVE